MLGAGGGGRESGKGRDRGGEGMLTYLQLREQKISDVYVIMQVLHF